MADEPIDDGQLLARFAASGDEAIFTELLKRHGDMVYRACRQVLGDGHAADDATQAVFLTLAKSARKLGEVRSLAAWLHRVAIRVALNLRKAEQRRARHEQESQMQATATPTPDIDLAHLLPQLHEELDALAETYRQPVVLHHLEGLTYADAARQLGCSEGTFSMRLSRAREMLRKRLTARGAVLSGVALASLLGQSATAGELPAALAASTAQAASGMLTGKAGAGLVSTQVTTLTEGAMRMLFWVKVKAVVWASAAVLVVAGVATPVVVHAVAAEPPPPVVIPGPDFVRPEVDPQLAAVLARQVRISQPGPMPFAEVVELMLRALPPGEGLEAQLLGTQSAIFQRLEDGTVRSLRDVEVANHVAMLRRRTIVLPPVGTVRGMLDAIGRELDLTWIATGEQVVFHVRYPVEIDGRYFAPFSDRSLARDLRLAAARHILNARHPPGFRALLRALVDADDPIGTEVARSTLEDNQGSAVLAEEPLAAAVRSLLEPGEAERIATAELARVAQAAHPPIATMRLLGLLRASAAVPVLAKTLATCTDPTGLGRMLARLSSRSSEGPGFTRAAAAEALGRIGGRPAVAALLTAFTVETRQDTLCAVIKALGTAQDPAAVIPLTAYLAVWQANNGRVWERGKAIEALGRIGDPRAEPAVCQAMVNATDYAWSFLEGHDPGAALLRVHTDATWQTMQRLLLSGGNERVRQFAATTLAELRDPRTVPALLQALADPGREWIRRGSAKVALARIGDPASFAALQKLALEHGNEEVFRVAAETLAYAYHPEASALLLDAFRRAKGSNRIWQIKGVITRWNADASALMEILKADPLPIRRRCAAEIYGGMGDDAIQTLLAMIDGEPDAEVRSGMVKGIGWSNGGQVMDKLLALAETDRQAPVRRAATEMLAEHMEDARVGPALLRRLAEDADPGVRSAAAWKLDRMINNEAVSLVQNSSDPLASSRHIAEQQDRIVEALVTALRQDPALVVRRAVANRSFSGPPDGSAQAKFEQAFLTALASEQTPEVQSLLVSAFFLRMSKRPDLIPVMLGIMQDVKRTKEVRDRACKNLSIIDDPSAKIRMAIKQYEREAKAPSAPAPEAPPEPKPDKASDF